MEFSDYSRHRHEIWNYLINQIMNYTHLNFWASNVKFILKLEISSPVDDKLFGVAQKPLNWMK